MSAPAEGPFLVIGCGRSGTSYVAGLLHASGIDMGRHLKPPDHFNERGYFEDVAVTDLHMRWLAQRGMTLMSISAEFPLDGTAEMEQQLRDVVRPLMESGRRWGIKPPGILFFWPLWQRMLPPTTYLLLPFRHPLAFAQSYVAGTGDTSDRALALWTSLNKLALHAIDSSGFASVVLDFDQPSTIAEALEPILGTVADTYDAGIHHHRSDAPLHGEVAPLYAELRRRAQGRRASTHDEGRRQWRRLISRQLLWRTTPR
jgi:hypothetical protein